MSRRPAARRHPEDLRAHCADVAPGQGRIAQCLEQNQDKLSAGGKETLAEVRQTR